MLKYLIAIALTWLCPAVFANRVQTNQLSIYEGLAGVSVNAIFNDGNNIIWIGTTNGLTIFNGKKMRTINVSPMHSKNIIKNITSTADGKIWLGTSNGVFLVDNQRSSQATRVIDEVNKAVNAILVVEKDLYICTDAGLFIYNIETKKTKRLWVNADHMSKTNAICDAKLDNKGHVWLLSSKDLFLFDKKKGVAIPMNITRKIKIYNVLRTMDIVGNRIFIGSYNDGVFEFNMHDKTINHYTDVDCRVITTISHSADNLYVGTDGAGVSVIDLGTNQLVKQYTTSDESEIKLLDNSIYSFLHLDNGVNFFGFYQRGLQYNYYTNPLFQVYQFGDFSTEKINVRSFYIDGKRKVIGTRNGLYFVDEERNIVKNYSFTQLGGGIVTNIVKYNGKYYFSTFNNGVSMLDPATMQLSRFGKNEALQTMSFGSMAVSPDNELWMSSNNGVYVYNSATGVERVFNKNNCSLLNSYVKSLAFDSKNRCWMGTELGLCIYNPIDDVISTDFPEGYFNSQPELICRRGKTDEIIAYCSDGLFRTNEDLTEFEHIDTEKTIGNSYVSMALYDNNHKNYWIGTERGLFCFDEKFATCSKFSEASGMNSRQFSSDAMSITDGKQLWVGTMEGLYYADLDKVAGDKHQNYKILIDDISVNDVKMSDNEMETVFNNNSIRLSYHWGVDKLSFVPVLLNLANLNNICYEYRINDGEWNVLVTGDKVECSDFSLGHNTLNIREAGKVDFTTYDVYVTLSPWYIAELLAVIGFMLVLYFAWNRQKKLERVRKDLEILKSKYSRVSLGSDESEVLYKQLNDYMVAEKPYMNPNLKLSDIAVKLNCSTVKLSQMLNVYANQNYYDYINKYRLAEFKQRVKSPEYKNYTLMALAEMCGFKKSSFFTTFKKSEGITPAEFAKNEGKD